MFAFVERLGLFVVDRIYAAGRPQTNTVPKTVFNSFTRTRKNAALL